MYLVPLGLIVMNAMTQAMNMRNKQVVKPVLNHNRQLAQPPGGKVLLYADDDGNASFTFLHYYYEMITHLA